MTSKRQYRNGAVHVLAVVMILMPHGGYARQERPPKPECDCDSRKQYYLSSQLSTGAEALRACIAGFHMASLWEIHDTSNLRYANQAPTVVSLDRGEGPPSGSWGWIRTGWSVMGGSNPTSGEPGKAHCFLWTNGTNNEKGTVVQLANDWTKQWRTNKIIPWDADTKRCNTRQYVWCVQD
jgi:hypothetical protein